MRHEEYLARRTELLSIRSDSFNSFDRAVLALATGGLALSVTFIDRIGKPFNTITLVLLLSTWISLSLVLVANMLSFFFAQRNMDQKISELDRIYRDVAKTRGASKASAEHTFWQKRATEFCNSASLVFFLIGYLSFTVYVILIQITRVGHP